MEIFKIGFISVTIIDVVDITVVAFLIYRIMRVITQSIALQGIFILFVLYVFWRVFDLLNLNLLRAVMERVLQLSSVLLVVIFAPEFRRLLLDYGRRKFFQKLREKVTTGISQISEYDLILNAVWALAHSRTGATIVIADQSDLSHIIKTGDQINAPLTTPLIQSIFYKNSPLHDGAVIIQNNMIVAARAVLPISDDPDLAPELGFRHRSALGISEVTDALAIVVSEETGKVSVCYHGRIKRNLSEEELRQFMIHQFGERLRQFS